jgi:hypothetical protein
MKDLIAGSSNFFLTVITKPIIVKGMNTLNCFDNLICIRGWLMPVVRRVDYCLRVEGIQS